MSENKLKSPYFKQLKRGKLGLFEEIYLRYCGRRDYKKGIVCKNKENRYISPFIEQEKNILGIAIRKEEEVFKRAIIKSQVGIKIVGVRKEGMQNKEKILEANPTVFLAKEKLQIEKSELPLKIREKELIVYKNLENEIMRIRCQEISHIVVARVSAYWSGVLHAASKENNEEEIRYIPLTYMDGKELLSQYFADSRLLRGEDDVCTE